MYLNERDTVGFDVESRSEVRTLMRPPINGTDCTAAVGGADLEILSSGASSLLSRDLSWKSPLESS